MTNEELEKIIKLQFEVIEQLKKDNVKNTDAYNELSEKYDKLQWDFQTMEAGRSLGMAALTQENEQLKKRYDNELPF